MLLKILKFDQIPLVLNGKIVYGLSNENNTCLNIIPNTNNLKKLKIEIIHDFTL